MPLSSYPTVRKLVDGIKTQPETVAVWLSGSLARGDADEYSDVDVRVAIDAEAVDRWRNLAAIPGVREDCVGAMFTPFGDEIFVHTLLFRDGEACDLCIQSRCRPPDPMAMTILHCTDKEFEQQLRQVNFSPEPVTRPVDPDEITRLLTVYWLNTQKHVKVLHRGLDIVAWDGVNRMQRDLIRLRYVEATGDDCGDLSRAGIYSLSPVARVVQSSNVLATIGLPKQNQEELCRAIETLNEAVSESGRALSRKLGVDYPLELENAVREGWQQFRIDHKSVDPSEAVRKGSVLN